MSERGWIRYHGRGASDCSVQNNSLNHGIISRFFSPVLLPLKSAAGEVKVRIRTPGYVGCWQWTPEDIPCSPAHLSLDLTV